MKSKVTFSFKKTYHFKEDQLEHLGLKFLKIVVTLLEQAFL